MNAYGGHQGLIHGLHETLHTRQLQNLLELSPDVEAVSDSVQDDDSPAVLAEHVAARLREVLAGTKPEHRVELTNAILANLSADLVEPGPTQLLSLFPTESLKRRQLRRPSTPLRKPALLTNGKDDPNLAAELRAEMGSANRVDLLCAFIRWTGLRLLEPALEDARDRGIPIRVITSTYMGATERRAIDELVLKYGAEVRINYETHATRLHAKAWLFRRDTGFDTAYVGSSNLSAPAMLDGLEWNVKLSSVGTPDLLRKFEITFDSYWEIGRAHV